MTALLRKVLSPVVELRENEVATSVMMFAYSFLVMTVYTTLKPVTRSKFIADLGADNLPLVQFAFGLVVGFIMQAYSTGFNKLPKRWALPITLVGLGGIQVAFWFWFLTGSDWALDRVLLLRPDPRHPRHQPVLDAGQHHLRPAAGEADLRVHRRRLEPRRHCRFVADDCRHQGRHLQPAARQRGHHGALRGPGHRDPSHREAGPPGVARRGRRRGRGRRRSGEAAEEQPPPADDRDDHRLCGHRRGDHRAAAEHGDGGLEGRREHRQHHQFPRHGTAVHVGDRLRDPGLAHEQDPALSRHRLRADDSARSASAAPAR